MRSKGLFFVLFLSVAFFSGCESRRTAALLDDIQYYLQDRPDSALAALQAISQEALSSSRLRARYSLLNAMALHKSYIDTADLSVIEPADRYYSRHGSALEKMKTLHQKGIIQMNGGNYPDAVISLSEAEKYIDQTEDWFNGGLICISLCKLYNKMHDNNEELSYAIKAEGHFEKVDKPVYYYDARIKHAIALNNLGKFQEAVDIYRDVLKSDDIDSLNKYSAMAHLAHTQVARQNMNPQEADSLFTCVIKETGSLPYWNNWGAYALASELAGNRKRADRIYAQLDTNDKKVSEWYSHSLYARGEYQNAYNHLILTIAGQTEMLDVALTQAAHKAQRDYAEKLRQESERRVNLQRILFIMGLALVILVSLVAYLLVLRRYERARQDNIRLAQAADILSHRIAEMQSAGDDKLVLIRQSYIKKYQSGFQRIGQLYETLVSVERKQDQKDIKTFLSDLRREVEEDSSMEEVLDAALDGVMSRFRKDYPNLTRRDYLLMSFIVAGFDATTISVVFDATSVDSVRMKKMRLKRTILKAQPQIARQYTVFF